MVRGYNLSITHLQFTDDTIFFCRVHSEQIVNIKRLLRCYEVSSSLKINFAKSTLVGVNVNEGNLSQWAELVKCKKGRLPFPYLGIPLGARMSSLAAWNPILVKIEKKLANWKNGFVTMAGRDRKSVV